ncbi:hypothetical protein GCM10017667_42970 [Streptomyces filamentosus]|uniref:Uncharacterized protein n=1 Tax=Streptomyces filamentosus TaxID=67294 RepID=A0A919EQ69_STRFL|nr:hypothetical protein GCM10017667_42970 [Streptomyces filamentosus]
MTPSALGTVHAAPEAGGSARPEGRSRPCEEVSAMQRVRISAKPRRPREQTPLDLRTPSGRILPY